MLSALANGFHELVVGVADEILKRSCLAVLIAHEHQGNERREQHGANGKLVRLQRDKPVEPVAVHAIADLIMVLCVHDKLHRWNASGMVSRMSAVVDRVVLRIHEAFGKSLRHMLKVAEVGVIAFALYCEQSVQGMMEIVVPLRI